MEVIIEHQGDRKNDPEVSRDRAIRRHDAIEEWPNSDSMSRLADCWMFHDTKVGTTTFKVGEEEFSLPNVRIIQAQDNSAKGDS